MSLFTCMCHNCQAVVMSSPALQINCDVINRMWTNQMRQDVDEWKSSFDHHWTVYVLSQCYFGVYFPCSFTSQEINTKITFLWVHKQFTTPTYTLSSIKTLYTPSQWKTTLHCNVVSHWLGAYTKWSLLTFWLSTCLWKGCASWLWKCIYQCWSIVLASPGSVLMHWNGIWWPGTAHWRNTTYENMMGP